MAWYDQGLNFECTKCGKCCIGPGQVYVTDEEMAAIRAYFGSEVDAPFAKVDGRWTIAKKRIHDEPRCHFLAEDGRCQIHAVKPSQCRAGPFFPVYLSSQERWERYGREVCEGVGQGPLISIEEITERLKQVPKLPEFDP